MKETWSLEAIPKIDISSLEVTNLFSENDTKATDADVRIGVQTQLQSNISAKDNINTNTEVITVIGMTGDDVGEGVKSHSNTNSSSGVLNIEAVNVYQMPNGNNENNNENNVNNVNNFNSKHSQLGVPKGGAGDENDDNNDSDDENRIDMRKLKSTELVAFGDATAGRSSDNQGDNDSDDIVLPQTTSLSDVANSFGHGSKGKIKTTQMTQMIGETPHDDIDDDDNSEELYNLEYVTNDGNKSKTKSKKENIKCILMVHLWMNKKLNS